MRYTASEHCIYRWLLVLIVICLTGCSLKYEAYTTKDIWANVVFHTLNILPFAIPDGYANLCFTRIRQGYGGCIILPIRSEEEMQCHLTHKFNLWAVLLALLVMGGSSFNYDRKR
jgi:hypothetical protein